MSSSLASTMAVLGQAGDLFRQWQIKAHGHSRATRRDGLCVPLLLLRVSVVRRGSLPCQGVPALWTAPQNWQWQHSEGKAEIFVKHSRCPMSTGQLPMGQNQPAFIFCPPHPAALVNGAGRAHCDIPVLCACSAAEGGREGRSVWCVVSLWGGRVTQSGRSRSLCWLVRSKGKGPC